MEVTNIDPKKVDVGLAVQSVATLASQEENVQQPPQQELNELVEMSMTSLLIKSKQSSGTQNQVAHPTTDMTKSVLTKTDGFDASIKEENTASN